MNKVILIGNLARDPEARATANGVSFCQFSVAVPRTYSGNDGKKEVDFLPVVAWRSLSDNVSKYCRKGSKTYGKWFGVELSEENKKQFYISEGFAHGFLVLSDVAEFCYKVTDFYHPNDEGGIAWNDPSIGIKWPEIVGEYHGTADPSGYTLQDGTPLTMSEKDKGWGTLEKK